jgi:glycosyltransferase involved in cell wall biosynthesis
MSIADAALMSNGSAWPRISIVTPSYNQGRFIDETIRSVLDQRYPNLEYIVIDGGSSDESVQIIKKYEPRLAYWVSEKDRGQTHAINKGLARATGEIFAYLNSDDLLVPGALVAVAEAFSRHPAADVIYGKCVYIEEDGAEIGTRQARFNGFADYLPIWQRIARTEHLTQPEVFCRMSALRRLGDFREDLRFVMDFEMWIRMMRAGFVFQPIQVPLAKFRLYREQKSSTAGEELHGVIRQIYDEMTPEERAETSKDFLSELNEARLAWLWQASRAATDGGATRRALSFCLKAFRLDKSVILRKAFWRTLAAPAIRLVRPT